jgi:hypothetical protein
MENAHGCAEVCALCEYHFIKDMISDLKLKYWLMRGEINCVCMNSGNDANNFAYKRV